MPPLLEKELEGFENGKSTLQMRKMTSNKNSDPLQEAEAFKKVFSFIAHMYFLKGGICYCFEIISLSTARLPSVIHGLPR